MSGSPRTSPVALFRDFFRQVVETRQRMQREGSALPLADAQGGLLAFLAAVANKIEGSDADSAILEQARYLMACYADDQLGREDTLADHGWRAHDLEEQIFHTERGATEVFQRVDRLIEIGDPGLRELGAAYLLALSLGFRGCHSGAAGERALARYRQRLLAFAVPKSRDVEVAQWITPAAYRHTLGHLERKKLPDLRRWRWVAFAGLAVLILASYWVFSQETGEISTMIDRILETRRVR